MILRLYRDYKKRKSIIEIKLLRDELRNKRVKDYSCELKKINSQRDKLSDKYDMLEVLIDVENSLYSNLLTKGYNSSLEKLVTLNSIQEKINILTQKQIDNLKDMNILLDRGLFLINQIRYGKYDF